MIMLMISVISLSIVITPLETNFVVDTIIFFHHDMDMYYSSVLYESFYNKDNSLENISNKKEKKCQLPSNNNPFMNVLQTDYKYRPTRPPACGLDKKIKQDIENKFDVNLYKDISDIYGKTNSQTQLLLHTCNRVNLLLFSIIIYDPSNYIFIS